MSLKETYRLSAEHLTNFENDGFVKLPNVIAPEIIEYYEPEVTAKVIELNTMHLPMEERSTYNKAFLQIHNLWQHSERVRELVLAERLGRIAAELMGVRGVRLYHDQALYKEAGGGITPWHADQYYWPLSSDRACTIWLPLQETPMPMGPLTFAAGSHRCELGRDLPISDESETALQTALADQNLPVVEEPYHLGEASFHLGWTFHRASPNTTDTPRRVMTVIYIDADMTIAEPVNHHQQHDLEVCFPGGKPGDPAATASNPLIYDAND